MNVKQQVKPEIETAIIEGLSDYRNQANLLKQKCEERYDVPEEATTEHFRQAIQLIDENQRRFADFAAGQIEKSADVDETGSVERSDVNSPNGVKVSPDGGSFFSDAAKDTYYLVFSSWNAFFTGWNLSRGNEILALISFLALCGFIAFHINKKYNIRIKPSE